MLIHHRDYTVLFDLATRHFMNEETINGFDIWDALEATDQSIKDYVNAPMGVKLAMAEEAVMVLDTDGTIDISAWDIATQKADRDERRYLESCDD